MQFNDSPKRVSRGVADKEFAGVRAACVLVALTLLSIARIDAAQNYSSLLQHNLISAPYPSSYPKQLVASAPQKSPPPVRSTPAPVRHDFSLNTAPKEVAQEKVPQPLSSYAQRASAEAENLLLVEKRVGAVTRSNSRPSIQIGYGRLFNDDSRTTGTKNGTRLEEPGCLYVKTTFSF